MWGVTGGASNIWDGVSVGDYVLFYFGDNTYRYAAKVIGTERDRTLPAELWDDSTLEVSGEDVEKPFECLLYLSDLIEVDIDSYEIHDYADHSRKFPQNFIPLNDEGLDAIEDQYDSIESYLQTRRVNPTVWIEKTEQEGRPYKQPGGDFELGTAIISPSQNRAGHDSYSAMREAEVGDIVLHLLKDRGQIVGLSTVSSDVIRDFEHPTEHTWTDAQREASGYLRKLEGYEELADPIEIYDEVLDNPQHADRLQRVYDAHTGLFYNTNFEIAQGGYVTNAPDELLPIFAAESTDLPEKLQARGYTLATPAPVESYDKVSDAEADIAARLTALPDHDNWLAASLADAIVADWTEMLSGLGPGTELTLAEEVKAGQLLVVYRQYETRLQKQAAALGAGGLNKLDPAQTLFIVLFRQLQEQAGVTTNLNQVKFSVILGEKYTVRQPEPEREDPPTPDGETLAAEAPPDDAATIRRQLTKNGQLVFYGPPGTGKTYTARRFARWWLNDVSEAPHESQLRTVTFHPSFSYEDFIEGLSASETDSGTVSYDIDPGVFKQIAEDAREAYQEHDDGEAPPYVLIIDEINRGDLAQIFGETITALEMDKRLDAPNETPISLAHSSKPFTIPPNLYVIGTMNTADRSIALVDTALRRRFRFLSFPPNYEVPREQYGFASWDALERTVTNGSDRTRMLQAASLLAVKQLNEQILASPDLGRGKQIGHSYLLGLEDTQDIVDAWRYEILPLLEEYCFGQFDRIREELFAGTGDQLFEWETEQIRAFDARALAEALTALLDLDPPVVLTNGGTESSAPPRGTLEVLFEAGILTEGTELVLRDGGLPAATTPSYDSDDLFWRCRLTGSRTHSDSVQWCYDESRGPTSLTGLAKHIVQEATGESKPNINGVDYWGHPEYDSQSLYALAEAVKNGTLEH
ncbi:McrB family protein [Halogranum amylolyticum]|uniref:McrB family protein n=1 Tax=Halogranum amylolyticum TaxID=660520 RepID=UPI00111471FA|nr:AAA family ATPase [Halogranum amylolyticum]